MNTITAKELRDNLGEVAKRVNAGEQINVTYRSKIMFKLEPVTESEQREPLSGLKKFLAGKPTKTPYDTNKSSKEIYHELLDKKHGK